MAKRKGIRNLVVISDTHCGCKLGLCPPEGTQLDDGGTYSASRLQRKLYSLWEQFWGEFVPSVTHGEPYAVVHNGDAIDGVHHGATTQISNNLEDQGDIAYRLLAPVVEQCEGRYYHIRGTEAHVGKSGVEEERLAKRLGAIKDTEGKSARYQLWIECGNGLVNLLHHIGTTGSSAGEATAVNAELIAAYVEAARWAERPPDIVVRSHRHRYLEVRFATAQGYGISTVTPGWQGKTPFSWKIAGARQAPPQFGGLIIRQGDRRLFVEPMVWTVEREKVENGIVENNAVRTSGRA